MYTGGHQVNIYLLTSIILFLLAIIFFVVAMDLHIYLLKSIVFFVQATIYFIAFLFHYSPSNREVGLYMSILSIIISICFFIKYLKEKLNK